MNEKYLKLMKCKIWKKHEGCENKGSWRIIKKGNGYDEPYEFKCDGNGDGCDKALSIFDVKEQAKLMREIK